MIMRYIFIFIYDNGLSDSSQTCKNRKFTSLFNLLLSIAKLRIERKLNSNSLMQLHTNNKYNEYASNARRKNAWSHGVMVSTLDSESSDPSSNLGGTYRYFFFILFFHCYYTYQTTDF